MEKLSGDLISNGEAWKGLDWQGKSQVRRCDAEDTHGADQNRCGREMRSKERKIRKETKT